MTDPLESLKAVLCDPEGRVCLDGSDGDRRVIQDALERLSQQAEPVNVEGPEHLAPQPADGFAFDSRGVLIRMIDAAPPATQQAEPVAWQGGLTNEELQAAFNSKLPSAALDPNGHEITAFAVGIEWAMERVQQVEPVALQRWGVKWKGQTEPFMEQMPDGYWTPWHIANEALQRAAPPADDEAVRLLHHVRMVLPNDRWADDTKRAIDAYLAKVKGGRDE